VAGTPVRQSKNPSRHKEARRATNATLSPSREGEVVTRRALNVVDTPPVVAAATSGSSAGHVAAAPAVAAAAPVIAPLSATASFRSTSGSGRARRATVDFGKAVNVVLDDGKVGEVAEVRPRRDTKEKEKPELKIKGLTGKDVKETLKPSAPGAGASGSGLSVVGASSNAVAAPLAGVRKDDRVSATAPMQRKEDVGRKEEVKQATTAPTQRKEDLARGSSAGGPSSVPVNRKEEPAKVSPVAAVLSQSSVGSAPISRKEEVGSASRKSETAGSLPVVAGGEEEGGERRKRRGTTKRKKKRSDAAIEEAEPDTLPPSALTASAGVMVPQPVQIVAAAVVVPQPREARDREEKMMTNHKRALSDGGVGETSKAKGIEKSSDRIKDEKKLADLRSSERVTITKKVAVLVFVELFFSHCAKKGFFGALGLGGGASKQQGSSPTIAGKAETKKKGEKMLSPPLSQKEKEEEKKKTGSKLLSSDEKKRNRESLVLSGMKRVQSDPELGEDGPFRGVLLHSDAAGPGGMVGGAQGGERERELIEEIMKWKKRYYDTLAEKESWVRQAEEWKDRFLEAQASGAAGVKDGGTDNS
jgi:hypothetical protein